MLGMVAQGGQVMRVFWVVLAILCLLATPGARAQTIASPEQFRDAVAARIQQLDPSAHITVRDSLSIGVSGATESTVNLVNAYREYSASPDSLNEIIDRFARAVTSSLVDAQDVRSRIVVILRPRAILNDAAQAAADLGPDAHAMTLIWRPFTGDLIQVVAIDGAETLRYATPDMLSDNHIGLDEAWSLAEANLPARLGQLLIVQLGRGRIYVASATSGLAPSALTQTARCGPGQRDFIALVTSRDTFMFALTGRRRDEERFLEAASRIVESGASDSRTAIRCSGGVWSEAPLPPIQRER